VLSWQNQNALFTQAHKEDTMVTAIYPGSFDPVTRGHLDIIKRAAKINDKLIVAVLINSAKHPLFTVEERVAMLQECCKGISNVSVESFDGLTVEFAKKKHASVMVRGLRAVTDFENEIQLAQTNHALMPGIETMFLATSIKWSYLSSTIVKEAAYYGSDISKFVTPNVEKAVNEKYALIRQGKDPEI
jgi:pantetheine-phosphate adenylyltransferase